MRTRQLNCLVIGDAEHVELRPAVVWLAERSIVTRSPDTVSLFARESIANDRVQSPTAKPYDLIVLAQARPGEFSAGEVETLHQAWPLARLVGLMGSWCEGEGRSGLPWPGVWRIPAISFPANLRSWMSADDRQTAPNWHLPRLATATDRLCAESATDVLRVTSPRGLALIAAATRDAYESLEDAFGQLGFSTVWQTPRAPRVTRGVAVAIWDAVRGDPAEWDDVAQFVQCREPTPTLVMVGFPRSDDLWRAERLSAAIWSGLETPRIGVLPKPFRLGELRSQLAGVSKARSAEQRTVKSA